jgi:hypothetical protein
MPTYADFGGWVISTIAGWFVVTADSSFEANSVSMGVATVQYDCCNFVMGVVPSAAKGSVGTC